MGRTYDAYIHPKVLASVVKLASHFCHQRIFTIRQICKYVL